MILNPPSDPTRPEWHYRAGRILAPKTPTFGRLGAAAMRRRLYPLPGALGQTRRTPGRIDSNPGPFTKSFFH